jgi:16S rRNA (adenine1518-N6/adenine1519-N6)-dimethyltransferase
VNASAVRAALARHRLLARRDLGQNFLVDDAMAERLVELAGVEPGETVIEIGAGLGTLTRALAARAARVVAIEIDAGLVRALRAESLLPDNARLLHADALSVDLAALVDGPTRVVGNLPYSAASPLLRRLLDLRGELRGWSVMLQREVAARVVAAEGTRDYGSLAVLHALTVRVEKCAELAPGLFHPAPRVRSSFLRITPLSPPKLAAGELAPVERVVRAAFSKRRKTLANALRGADLAPEEAPRAIEELLRRLGIDPRTRAERLAPERLLELARALAGQARGARAQRGGAERRRGPARNGGGGAGGVPWS